MMLELCCHRFTAAEGGARLAATAAGKNTLVTECGAFISTRLLHEEAYNIRGLLSSGRQRSVRICRSENVKPDAYELRILTDLLVTEAQTYQDIQDWAEELETKEVLVCASEVLKRILEEGILTMAQINVLIIDSCHMIYKDENLQYIMKIYKQSPDDKRPRILALTYPLFSSTKKDIDDFDSDTEDTIDNMQICEKLGSGETEDNALENETNEKTIDSVESDRKTIDKVEEMGVYENLDDFEMYEKLEWKIDQLEKELCCQMDLAEDIDGCKRISGSVTKPKELIIEYSVRPPAEHPGDCADLDQFMRSCVRDTLDFLNDHRHDPTEIYGDELYEEFKSIPDPTIEPKQMFTEFLYVLEELGPYAADKAAFHLLIKLEKSKIKVPYERHFLLLRLCTTIFVKIRCHAESVFNKYTMDWDKIRLFSTPKLLRFVEILEQFTPPDQKEGSQIHKNFAEMSGNNATDDKADSRSKDDSLRFDVGNALKTSKMLKDLELCDFATLGDKIEDRLNTFEANLKDLDAEAVTDASECASKDDGNMRVGRHAAGGSARRWARARARGRARAALPPQHPRALCGIVFVQHALMAKIIFMLCVDLSRSRPSLAYLRCQYCAVEPMLEQKESQRQGKRHEEVLKKFRMHECNLLLTTSALEEGIDLPRCNLVLRWDVPISYRSYGLCRGRARAPRAAAAVLCGQTDDTTDLILHNLATYTELDQLITRKCGCGVQDEPTPEEETHADAFTPFVKAYAPSEHTHTQTNATCTCHKDKAEKDLENRMRKINIGASKISEVEPIESVTESTVFGNVESESVPKSIDVRTIDSVSESIDPVSESINDKEIKSVSKSFESVSESIDNKTIECVSKSIDVKIIDSVLESIDPVSESINDKEIKSASKSISVSESIDYKTIECVSKSIDDKAIENVPISTDAEAIDSVSKLSFVSKHLGSVSEIVESVTKSINIVSKSIDSVSESIESISQAIDSVEDEVTKTIESNKISDNHIHDAILSENIKNIKVSSMKPDNHINSDINDSYDNKCSCLYGDNNVDNKKDSDVASVDLSTSIALINRYCAKLPSDTFTRLAPQWWLERVRLPGATRDSYICTLRLPLNCPLKYNIVGHPMPTRVLARRMVALQACRILHKSGELDNQLMPIGKENFKAAELETTNVFNAAGNIEKDSDDSARPGTTKRRQYYYKRTAGAFTDCQPVVDASDSEIDPPGSEQSKPIEGRSNQQIGGKRNMLYAIVSSLWCALPERYNTRGRRLHQPQHARQALGILMSRSEPTDLQIPAFPVYTRSGEVRVSVEHIPDADVRVSPRRGRLVRRFMRFVFTEVLRVRRRGMKLQSEGSTKNNYYIVPTCKKIRQDGTTKIDIDWPFLELIYQHTEDKKLSDVEKPLFWDQDEEETASDVTARAREGENEGEGATLSSPLLRRGETFVFDYDAYNEAVVTPWYRNRDQPQFFLVAEICWNLSPDSAFPSEVHNSFRSYYRAKYNVDLTQPNQPLLDVDHTSARLNLLTPRYVNRKGVALPVSSERTRRAKRDRLDQKQILVPELCRVHPFASPLWFSTVALPCVLYRINALLIADEIRRAVAIDVGLGLPKIDNSTAPGFKWPALDFGWSLSEVLNADAEKNEKKKEEEREKEREREQKEKELRDKELEQKQLESVTEDAGVEEDATNEVEGSGKTVNDILAEKMDVESGFEIGTWSNDMASSIPDPEEYDEMLEPLPPNLTFCTSASGGVNWCDPVQKTKNEFNPTRGYSVADSDCSYISSDFDTDDSDFDVEDSDDDTDTSGFCSSRTSNNAVGVRIEYKTAHEAEAVDVGRKRPAPSAPQRDPRAARRDRRELLQLMKSGVPDAAYVEKFKRSVEQHKNNIVAKGNLIKKDIAITELLPELPETKDNKTKISTPIDDKLQEIFPYKSEINIVDGQISLESIEKNKRVLLAKLKESLPSEEIKKLNCFSMVDVNIDSPTYVNEKIMNVGFDSKEKYMQKVLNYEKREFKPYFADNRGQNGKEFDFDYQPDLEGHPGPSPSVILQALTMSNANDGINLERLETIGDSFLKFAITAYLYCAHPTVHEGKLSHMRSKQVSNLNLYRLGRAKRLGSRMIASKFEPHDNWLPPCHRAPPTPPHDTTDAQDGGRPEAPPETVTGCYIPYNLITQHSIPDKSIADCVEALIGAYLLECGPRGALLFMSWLGISVLPQHRVALPGALPAAPDRGRAAEKPPHTPSPKRQRTVSESSSSSAMEWSEESQSESEVCEGVDCEFVGPVGARHPYKDADGNWYQVIFGELKAPPSPLLRYIADPEGELDQMLSGYDALERTLQYRFKDRSLLLQALTHASHQRNRLTDCYQRLEFLGDAILDYLITRHLYEDPRRHCPGALTDLRSALVNNTIFATLAVRHGFHKYFRHMSPGLNEVLTKYVRIQEENGHSISEEHYLIQEDELEQAEDVEVPKALGDLFESVAGAIFLDSGMSLGAVWQSYVRLMGAELEAFSAAAPKSPVRELLEAEPDTAKFGKPERLADGRRVRVCVEVFGRGTFKGIGRNYRIAKGTAARCALRHLKIHRR